MVHGKPKSGKIKGRYQPLLSTTVQTSAVLPWIIESWCDFGGIAAITWSRDDQSENVSFWVDTSHMRKSRSVLFCLLAGMLNARQGSESLEKQCPSEIGCHLLLSSFRCYFSSSCLRRMPVSIQLVTLTRCVACLRFIS